MLSAAVGNNAATLTALLNSGANPNAVDELGRSALSWMSSHDNSEGLVTLLKNEVPQSPEFHTSYPRDIPTIRPTDIPIPGGPRPRH
jgi:ankyrin repeat protein